MQLCEKKSEDSLCFHNQEHYNLEYRYNVCTDLTKADLQQIGQSGDLSQRIQIPIRLYVAVEAIILLFCTTSDMFEHLCATDPGSQVAYQIVLESPEIEERLVAGTRRPK